MSEFVRPDDLGARGSRLWESANADREFGSGEIELLVEACRVVDVLEELAGDMSKLVEARHQRALFRQLIVTLGLQEDDEPAKRGTSWGTEMAMRKHHGR